LLLHNALYLWRIVIASDSHRFRLFAGIIAYDSYRSELAGQRYRLLSFCATYASVFFYCKRFKKALLFLRHRIMLCPNVETLSLNIVIALYRYHFGHMCTHYCFVPLSLCTVIVLYRYCFVPLLFCTVIAQRKLVALSLF
jgi:hypothetical protein